MAVLEIEGLSISFTQYVTGFKQQVLRIVDGLDLSVKEGEIVAVIGSSGSGKSLLAHAIMGLLPDNAATAGTIRYCGEALDAERQAALRGREIALVPQAVTYLDPLMRVGQQVRLSVRGADPVAEQRNVFKRYRLEEKTERMFPFQLSGGMARRVLVSTATVSGARLIIADEPTPGMHQDDVKEALRRFKELAVQGSSVLLISHDLESALQIADKVAVFYAGTILEIALAQDFAGSGERLRHPYSKALWQALPQNDFIPIAGAQPVPGAQPSGCLFAPRCAAATPDCAAARPAMRELNGGRVRCIHAT